MLIAHATDNDDIRRSGKVSSTSKRLGWAQNWLQPTNNKTRAHETERRQEGWEKSGEGEAKSMLWSIKYAANYCSRGSRANNAEGFDIRWCVFVVDFAVATTTVNYVQLLQRGEIRLLMDHNYESRERHWLAISWWTVADHVIEKSYPFNALPSLYTSRVVHGVKPRLIRSVRAINIEEMRRLNDSDRNRVQQDIVAHLLRKHHWLCVISPCRREKLLSWTQHQLERSCHPWLVMN